VKECEIVNELLGESNYDCCDNTDVTCLNGHVTRMYILIFIKNEI